MNQPQTDYSGEEENDIDQANDLPARLDPLIRVLNDLSLSDEIDGYMVEYRPPKHTKYSMIELARIHNCEDKFAMILVFPKSPA